MIYDEYVNYEKRLEEVEAKKLLELEGSDTGKEKVKRLPISEGVGKSTKTEEISDKMLLSAKIIERMITQNIFSEIAFDFKYWEDRSDDFKEFEGTLFPLWNFSFDETSGQDVTCLSWSPEYPDLFAAAFGSYNFYKQPQDGKICLFSLKNCSHPEYVLFASSGVFSVDFHPGIY